jgi:hypothetical protein
MLEFNPYYRPTAKQLLKNPIFDKIRDPMNEKAAPFKIKIKFDAPGDDDETNYSEEISDQKKQKQRFLKMIVKEY